MLEIVIRPRASSDIKNIWHVSDPSMHLNSAALLGADQPIADLYQFLVIGINQSNVDIRRNKKGDKKSPR